MSTPTPGPWTIAPCSDRDETRDVVADYKEIQREGHTFKQAHWICEIDAQIDSDLDVEEQFVTMEANAHLISAAPDLLDVLKRFVAFPFAHQGGAEGPLAVMLQQATVAIAKAEGKGQAA